MFSSPGGNVGCVHVSDISLGDCARAPLRRGAGGSGGGATNMNILGYHTSKLNSRPLFLFPLYFSPLLPLIPKFINMTEFSRLQSNANHQVRFALIIKVTSLQGGDDGGDCLRTPSDTVFCRHSKQIATLWLQSCRREAEDVERKQNL